jgi:hypothetical protein
MANLGIKRKLFKTFSFPRQKLLSIFGEKNAKSNVGGVWTSMKSVSKVNGIAPQFSIAMGGGEQNPHGCGIPTGL